MGDVKITTDIFFRYLFGSESNKDLLLDFINAVLVDADFRPVKDVFIKNPFNLSNLATLKESILDVKAIDENGSTFDIEVQVAEEIDFGKRTLYYWAKNYSEQLEKGDEYYELKPVICINILNYNLFDEIDKIHACFLIKEKDRDDFILNDHFQIHFIEMSKFERDSKDINEILKQWLLFMKYGDKEDLMRYAITDEKIYKAKEEYKKFTMNDELKESYEAHMKWVRDYNSGLSNSFSKGKIEGKIETARKMKEDGLSVEVISKYTGLSRDEIENSK